MAQKWECFSFTFRHVYFFKGIFAFGGTPISCMEWENGSHKATACQCSALFLGVEKRTGHRDSQNTDSSRFNISKIMQYTDCFRNLMNIPGTISKSAPAGPCRGRSQESRRRS